MRKLMASVSALVMLWGTVPAGAYSLNECYALNREIQKARSLERTGGFAKHASVLNAQKAEKAARDEMVRLGCNKRINANKPECQAVIAQVNAAKADLKATEGPARQSIRSEAAARVVELTATYQVECLSERRNPRTATKKDEPTNFDPEAAAAVAGAIMTLGIFGTRSPSGPRGPGPRHR